MHTSRFLQIVGLIFYSFTLMTISGMASDGWIGELKKSNQPGRIYELPVKAMPADASSARPVIMRHGTFYLDRDFQPQLNRDKGHLLIRLANPLNASIERQLQALGVELLEYIPENTWKAVVPANQLAAVRGIFGVLALGNIYPVDKFPPHMLKNGPAPHSYMANGIIS
jgi:hypothetical protein